MGKTSRKHRERLRADPTAKPIKLPTDPELAALREQKILPVLNELSSPETKRRVAAAVAIANLIEDKKCRKLLLREQIVKILLEQTTTDATLESKSAGWGILSNLAIEEEADFCVHLYRQDVLSAIAGIVRLLVDTIQSSTHPVSKLPKAQQQLMWTLSRSVVGLITSMSEANEEIIQAISQIPTIIIFLFTYLGHDDIPDELYMDILSCLASLTEDNPVISQMIVENVSWLSGLIDLQASAVSRAVVACGILHNIYTSLQWFDHNTPRPGAADANLVPTLINAVSKGSGQANGHSTPDQVLQLALQITASIATSLQEALEDTEHSKEKPKKMIKNESESDDEDMILDDDVKTEGQDSNQDFENDDVKAEEDEEDEMTMEEIEEDMARVLGDGDVDEEEFTDDQPTLAALIRIATPVLLKLASTATPESTGSSDLQTSVLSAMNNIAWTVSNIDLAASSAALEKSWTALAQSMWDQCISPVLAANTADIDLAATITGLAWAIARSLHGKVMLRNDEQRKFMALYQASKELSKDATDSSSDAFDSLSVKCIGVLGRLAQSPAPVLLNREIGVFLLTSLASLPETPPADAIQALNELFEVYADKIYECDEVFVKDGFLRHLEEIKSKVRVMAKSVDKRKQEELRTRADEAVHNLNRFIKYKRDELSRR